MQSSSSNRRATAYQDIFGRPTTYHHWAASTSSSGHGPPAQSSPSPSMTSFPQNQRPPSQFGPPQPGYPYPYPPPQQFQHGGYPHPPHRMQPGGPSDSGGSSQGGHSDSINHSTSPHFPGPGGPPPGTRTSGPYLMDPRASLYGVPPGGYYPSPSPAPSGGEFYRGPPSAIASSSSQQLFRPSPNPNQPQFRPSPGPSQPPPAGVFTPDSTSETSSNSNSPGVVPRASMGSRLSTGDANMWFAQSEPTRQDRRRSVSPPPLLMGQGNGYNPQQQYLRRSNTMVPTLSSMAPESSTPSSPQYAESSSSTDDSSSGPPSFSLTPNDPRHPLSNGSVDTTMGAGGQFLPRIDTQHWSLFPSEDELPSAASTLDDPFADLSLRHQRTGSAHLRPPLSGDETVTPSEISHMTVGATDSRAATPAQGNDMDSDSDPFKNGELIATPTPMAMTEASMRPHLPSPIAADFAGQPMSSSTWVAANRKTSLNGSSESGGGGGSGSSTSGGPPLNPFSHPDLQNPYRHASPYDRSRRGSGESASSYLTGVTHDGRIASSTKTSMSSTTGGIFPPSSYAPYAGAGYPPGHYPYPMYQTPSPGGPSGSHISVRKSSDSERPLIPGMPPTPEQRHQHSAVVTATKRSPIVYPALLSRVAEAFKIRITLSERQKDALSYKEAFDGREAVDKIAYIIKTTDRNLALLLGRALDAQKFFHDVTYEHRLRDSQHEIYQFRERLPSPFTSADEVNSHEAETGSTLTLPRIRERPPLPDDMTTQSTIGTPGSVVVPTNVSPHVEDPMFPNGVFTLLTDCYSPTCTRDRLCYSIACPRRLEQQARLNLKPKPVLNKEVPDSDLGDLRLGSEPGVLWIHSVPQDIVDSVSDLEKKRQEAINELMYTERDFVRDMEYLRDSWIKPLRSSNVIPESRREDFVTQVFWNILEVYTVNSAFAEALTKRQNSSYVVKSFADLFLDYLPHFGPPFIKYGSHQLYGKYEFEKEKSSNPAFSKFVDEVERLPESRKLELNGYLTKPTTRLARYPLLLESINKHTPEGNPDKIHIPKAVKLIREVLSRLNAESGKAENRFNLAQLDQQLVFKPGELVDLRLRDENREMIFKGPLKKRGGQGGESAELQVFLFDHALLMVKPKTTSKVEQYKVYRKPIPLELLVVTVLDDTPSGRTAAPRPKSLMGRAPGGKGVNGLNTPIPNNKQGYAMMFTHLGRKGYTITLWAASWTARKKWLEKIEGRQTELRERSMVFETIRLSDGYFVGANKVTAAAPFDFGRRIVYGTDNGVYLATLGEKDRVPIKVISVPNVTQLDVLEEHGVLVVLADRAIQTFFIDMLDPGDAIGAAKRARKISSSASFFKTGTCLNRTLVCVVKCTSTGTTIKTLEPIEQHYNRGRKQPAIRKFLPSNNEALRVLKEFYIQQESSSLHYLKSKLCLGCTKGFEIVDLETLATQGLLDPADSSLDFCQKRDNVRPISIYRVEGDFLLCYDEFAFYVNKNGWRARSNWIIHWEGNPTSFALCLPYVLAFDSTFVEVRHVQSGALMQIIPANYIRLLFADTPPSTSSPPIQSHLYPSQGPYFNPGFSGQDPRSSMYGMAQPRSIAQYRRSEILFACDADRVFRLQLAPPPAMLVPS